MNNLLRSRFESEASGSSRRATRAFVISLSASMRSTSAYSAIVGNLSRKASSPEAAR
jgi:hypothetical protein